MIWQPRWSERHWEAAGVLVAAASLAYSGYAGQQQKSAAKKGMRLQEEAQQEAQNAAISTSRKAAEDEKRARAQAPDLNVLLADQQKFKGGSQGINAEKLLLGKPSALGY